MAASKVIATIEVGSKRMIESPGRAATSSGKFVSVTGKGIISARLKNYANEPFFSEKGGRSKSRNRQGWVA